MPPQIGGSTLSGPLGFSRQQDLDVSRALELLRELRAQAEQEEEELAQQRIRTRLLDPLEAAKLGEQVRQFRERRDVSEVLPPPTPAQRVAGLRRRVLPPELRSRVPIPPEPNAPVRPSPEEAIQVLRGTRRISEGPAPARRIRRFGTAPGLTEARAAAEAVRDPNFPAAYAGREAEARLSPYVLAAEAYASRPTTTGKADADAEQYISVNLPRLASLATELNQLGGPPGVVGGAVRRHITGPSQVDELAREFQGIHGALALNLAAKFNRGRPTEPDREAAAAILPQLGDSPELTQRRIALILQALGNPNQSSIRDPLTGREIQIRSGGGGTAAPAVGAGRFRIEQTAP